MVFTQIRDSYTVLWPASLPIQGRLDRSVSWANSLHAQRRENDFLCERRVTATRKGQSACARTPWEGRAHPVAVAVAVAVALATAMSDSF